MKRTDETLLRTARFHTIEWRGEWVWWAEPLELLASPVMLVAMSGLMVADVFPPTTADVKVPFRSRLLMLTAPLNPAVTLLGTRIERRHTLGEDLFIDSPSELRYAVHQPVHGLSLSFQVFAEDGTPLASGMARTDELGEARIPGLSARPAMVRVGLPDGEKRIVP